MVLEKNIFSRNINITNEDFDISRIYKGVKSKGEDLGYGFVEQEQSNKPGKYGHTVVFKFLFVKQVDFFGTNEISLDFNFENLSKVAGKDHGDCKIAIKGKVTLDYKNRWGMTAFNRFLLNLYSKVKDGEMKSKYMGPLIKDANEMHDFIKDKFGFYVA